MARPKAIRVGTWPGSRDRASAARIRKPAGKKSRRFKGSVERAGPKEMQFIRCRASKVHTGLARTARSPVRRRKERRCVQPIGTSAVFANPREGIDYHAEHQRGGIAAHSARRATVAQPRPQRVRQAQTALAATANAGQRQTTTQVRSGAVPAPSPPSRRYQKAAQRVGFHLSWFGSRASSAESWRSASASRVSRIDVSVMRAIKLSA